MLYYADMTEGMATTFATDGAQLFKGVLKSCQAALEAALVGLAADEAGVRIHGVEALHPLLAYEGCIGAVAATVLGAGARPVRTILFNKTPDNNWSLAWHQDRTICVRERHEVSGFGPWTVKSGMNHVAPPFDLLAKMVTIRRTSMP